MMTRSLLGLTVLAAAAPAWAGQVETAGPIQAVMQEFPNEKGVLAYYTPEAGKCELVLMTDQEPGPRVRVSLTPDQAATIEDVSGGALRLTCGLGAAQMVVERTPAPLQSASAKQ